jgi:hypothetical protein
MGCHIKPRNNRARSTLSVSWPSCITISCRNLLPATLHKAVQSATSTSHNTHFRKTGQTATEGTPRQPIQTIRF